LFRALDDLQRVRVLEQRLRRNAPPEEAGAAERFLLLDDCGLEAELAGADGGHVAAGAGADDDDVVFVGLSHGVVCGAIRSRPPAGGQRGPLRDESGTNDWPASV